MSILLQTLFPFRFKLSRNTEQSTLTAQASDQQFKAVVAQTQVSQALGGWTSSHAPSFCIKSVRSLGFQKTFTLVRSPTHGCVMRWRNLISQASSRRKYCICGKKCLALPLGREAKTPWTWPSAEGCCWSQRDQKRSIFLLRGVGRRMREGEGVEVSSCPTYFNIYSRG